jgi:hypothetical protein
MSRERRKRKYSAEADDRLVEAMKESLARVTNVKEDEMAYSPVKKLDLTKVQEQAEVLERQSELVRGKPSQERRKRN